MNFRPPETWLESLPSSVSAGFVSDLHLFSPRSRGEYVARSMFGDAPDLLILGGDIFDFRWTKYASIEESVDLAEKWIRDLLHARKQTHVLYLLGNHDCLVAHEARLQQIALETSRFCCMPYHASVGDSLFVHGDILDAVGRRPAENDQDCAELLLRYRSGFEHTGAMPRAAHLAYDGIAAMRVHKLVPKVRHRPAATCSKLFRLLCTHDPTLLDLPPKRVFFGHTHVAIDRLELNEMLFCNPGASLRYMNYAPVTFQLDV